MLRTVLGGLAAVPLALALGIRPPREKAAVALLVLSALSGVVLFPVLFTIGQRMTSAMHGGLILASAPIVTGLFAAAFERRRPANGWWIGSIIALAGEALLILLRAPAGETPSSLIGDLLVLAGALIVGLG
jgi:drug/metabolite transporter (DMT)-like permease